MSRYYYFDSSAWVKLYFEEPGSKTVRELFYRTSRKRRLSTVLGYVEVAGVLARQKKAAGFTDLDLAELDAVLDRDWELFTYLTLDNEVFQEAITVARQFGLRGADAIHLATAILVDG